MLSNEFNWPESLIEELNTATRLYLFDWERIATHLQQFVVARELSIHISPDNCRENFAANASNDPQNRSIGDYPENEGFHFIQERKAHSLPSYEGMSLEDLIETVDRNEREMKRKKEEIFQRVLNSLGEFEFDQSLILQEDPAISAYQTAISKRIENDRIQLLKYEEFLEREKLGKEREKLKKRFDPDSEDCLGENPQIMEKDKHVDSEFDEIPAEISESFSLQSFIEGEEFERVLTELEKELDAQAMEKSGSLSELGEVILFLETKGVENDPPKKEPDLSANILAESQKLAQLYSKIIEHDRNTQETPSDTRPNQKGAMVTPFTTTNTLKSSTRPSDSSFINRRDNRNTGRTSFSSSKNDEGDSDSDQDWSKIRAKLKCSSNALNQSSTTERIVANTPSISNEANLLVEQRIDIPQANESNFLKESELFVESCIPTAEVEGLEKAMTFLEEIIPVISADSVPLKSGSLLSGGFTRREKGRKKS
eukprot:gene966-1025_t